MQYSYHPVHDNYPNPRHQIFVLTSSPRVRVPSDATAAAEVVFTPAPMWSLSSAIGYSGDQPSKNTGWYGATCPFHWSLLKMCYMHIFVFIFTPIKTIHIDFFFYQVCSEFLDYLIWSKYCLWSSSWSRVTHVSWCYQLCINMNCPLQLNFPL